MKGMKKYYTQKIMWYLLTLVFAVLLNFILPRLMPGDPVSTIASKSVEGMTDATAIQKYMKTMQRNLVLTNQCMSSFLPG